MKGEHNHVNLTITDIRTFNAKQMSNQMDFEWSGTWHYGWTDYDIMTQPVWLGTWHMNEETDYDTMTQTVGLAGYMAYE